MSSPPPLSFSLSIFLLTCLDLLRSLAAIKYVKLDTYFCISCFHSQKPSTFCILQEWFLAKNKPVCPFKEHFLNDHDGQNHVDDRSTSILLWGYRHIPTLASRWLCFIHPPLQVPPEWEHLENLRVGVSPFVLPYRPIPDPLPSSHLVSWFTA